MSCFELMWENVSVNISIKSEGFWSSKVHQKCILDSATGSMKNGSMVAIMGPSGAGKTTLLASLSGRLKEKEGTIKINGTKVKDKDLKSYAGYLYQGCIFPDYLTVEEHITFMAALKLRNMSKLQRRILFTSLLQEFNLFSLRKTSLKNLSGGEKKRLSLATELLNDPDILFCDEPITGLDSYSANIVIEKLKEKSREGKLIVVTIHQPSAQIFEYFTHIVLVSNGKQVYQGPVENCNGLLESVFSKTTNSYSSKDGFCKSIQETSMKELEESLRNRSIQHNKPNGNSNYESNWPKNVKVKNSLFAELYWLLWRIYWHTRRNKSVYMMKFVLVSVMAVVVSIIYKDIEMNDVNSKQNISGFLYFITTDMLFRHLYVVINTFPEEFSLFLREKELYSTHSYFISKAISLIPRNIVMPSAYLAVVFLLVGFLMDIVLYFKMVAILFISCSAASSIGLAVSACFNSFQLMDVFLAPLDAFFLIMTGVVMKIPDLPDYIQWLKFLAPYSSCYESLTVLQWTSIDHIVYEVNGNVTLETSKQILTDFGYPPYEVTAWWNFLFLCFYSLCICLIGYFGLLRKRYKYYSY